MAPKSPKLRRVVEIRVPRRATPFPKAGQQLRRMRLQSFRARLFLRALRKALLMRVDPAPPGCYTAVEIVLHEWTRGLYITDYIRPVLFALVPGVLRDGRIDYVRGVSIRCEPARGRGLTVRLWIYEGDLPPASAVKGLEPQLELLVQKTGRWASLTLAQDLADRLEKTIVDIDPEPLRLAMKKRKRRTK